MRGKRSTELPERGQTRNIPAYAGKTARIWIASDKAAEHPRVCGENQISAQPALFPFGTSPRMRGKLDEIIISELAQRNIPAYAGKTAGRTWSVVVPREHPRVCGENLVMAFLTAVTNGTSPRMRGKPSGRLFGLIGRRNIPAYAGKT